MKTVKLHFNKPQLKSIVIGAPFEVDIMGRGTGKTIGILAPKTSDKYMGTMPRGTGVLINATYTQAFTRLLPELVRGWQRLGYENERHFIIGKRPSEKWKKLWKWEGPYAPPMDYKYFVSWWNGAGAHIVSQERPGSSNGLSIDWIAGDEAKLLNEEKLKTELYPANRGKVPAFANNPYHHGITLTTDMPVGTAGRWLLDRVNAMDREVVNQIWALQCVKFKLKHFLKKASAKLEKEYQKQIEVVEDEINDLRKGLLFYQEASTLENIHALGEEYILQQLRDTSQFQFDTQILNLRPMKMEDGFYPDFDEEYHGYFAEDSSYFDNTSIDYLNPVFDCRKDKDLNPDLPLDIAGDYNRRIHLLVVGQVYPDEIRIVKGMHVLYPKKLKDVIKDFNAYYKHHKRRFIRYWYDHTAVGEQHDTRICDDVISGLRAAGWIVQPMYIGNRGVTGTHEAIYRMYGDLLGETGKYSKKLRMNRENCDKLILSICMAEAIQVKDGYGKNKKPEHDPKFPAEEATHFSEGLDVLLFGLLESGINYKVESKSGGAGIIMT